MTTQPGPDDRYAWDDAYSSAPPTTVLLPTPCWLIDRDDDWETYHHPTREDAEHEHADRVRSDYGYPLSVAGAFATYPGTPVQLQRRCREWTCPEPGCGQSNHDQDRVAGCGECGFEFVIDQVAVDDPHQPALF